MPKKTPPPRKTATGRKRTKRAQKGKAGGGSESAYTTEDFAAALEKAGGNQTAAAESLGVSRMTVWRAIKKWPGLQEVIEAAEAELIDVAEGNVAKLVRDGDQRASEFLLRYRAKERWSTRHEMTGAEGAPIQYSDMSEAEIDQRLNDLQTAIAEASGDEAGDARAAGRKT